MIACLKRGEKEPGCEVGAKQMKCLLANNDMLISHVLQRTNGSISWSMVALMVAVGEDRIQSMPANTVPKYVMRSFGIQIHTNKFTVNNQ